MLKLDFFLIHICLLDVNTNKAKHKKSRFLCMGYKHDIHYTK